MYLPKNGNQQISHSTQIEFRGMNHNDYLGDNEFYDMQNMSGDQYPVLSTRQKRMINSYFGSFGHLPSGTTATILGMNSNGDVLVRVIEERTALPPSSTVKVYVGLTNIGTLQGSFERQILFIGNRVVIFPDKVYFEISDAPVLTNIEFSYPILYNSDNGYYMQVFPSVEDDPISVLTVSDTAPSSSQGEVGDKWLVLNPLNANRARLVKTAHYTDNVYSESWDAVDFKAYWTPIGDFANPAEDDSLWDLMKAGDYIFASATELSGSTPGLFVLKDKTNRESFTSVPFSRCKIITNLPALNNSEAGDEVTFYGFTPAEAQETALDYREEASFTARIYSNKNGVIEIDNCIDFILKHQKAFYPDAPGLLKLSNRAGIKAIDISVTRFVPDMDFVCERNNRLWGCSSEKHEIYASKLGNFKSWHDYSGLSTDSYALTVGSARDFTGAFSFNDAIYFFKDHLFYKITGTKPANFTLSTIYQNGVEKGSHNSICNINNALYYKSIDGIMRYDGYYQTKISAPIGVLSDARNAHAGTIRGKYYLSMQWGESDKGMFVYDTTTGLWHKEDNTYAKYFTNFCNSLCFCSVRDLVSVLTGVSGFPESWFADEDFSTVPFFAETGEISYGTVDQKYLSKIQVRFWISSGASFSVSLLYDRGNTWEQIYTCGEAGIHTAVIPVIPKRCESVRMKFSGNGECKVFAVSKYLETGSEVK